MPIEDLDGKRLVMTPPPHPCLECMMLCTTCGTGMTVTQKMLDKDTLVHYDATFLGCLKASPCPCLPGCVV